MIRHIASDARLTEEMALQAIEAAVPVATVDAVVVDLGVTQRRRRKLPAEVTLLLVIAMNLFTHDSLAHVLGKLCQGVRLLWPDPDIVLATKGAICQARYRLGPRPWWPCFTASADPWRPRRPQAPFCVACA